MSLPLCPTCGGPEGAAALVEAEGKRLGEEILRAATDDVAREEEAVAERDRLLAEAWTERDAAIEERDRLRAQLQPEALAAALYAAEHGDWSRAPAHWRKWSMEKAGRVLAALRAGTGEGDRG